MAANILPLPEAQKTVALWAAFGKLHNAWYESDKTPVDVAQFTLDAKAFKSLFVGFQSRSGSYGRSNFTPYMHIVCDHFPNIIARLRGNNLRRFSGEPTESICKLARRAFRLSSHRNNTADVLVKKQMLEVLINHRHKSRKYTVRKVKPKTATADVAAPEPAALVAAEYEAGLAEMEVTEPVQVEGDEPAFDHEEFSVGVSAEDPALDCPVLLDV